VLCPVERRATQCASYLSNSHRTGPARNLCNDACGAIAFQRLTWSVSIRTGYYPPRAGRHFIAGGVILVPIEPRQVVQRGDAAVAAHMQTAPNRRVDLEEQDVELVNFDRSIWLDHSGPRSLVAADSAPGFSRSLLEARTCEQLKRTRSRYKRF